MRPTSILLAASLVAAAFACTGPGAGSLDRMEVPCVRVVDGDTVVVRTGTGDERVRLIGIDCPESGDPRPERLEVARLATELVRERVAGRTVELRIDPTSLRDAYGRLLAYLHTDGVDIGAELVGRGLAVALTRFPHPRMDDYLERERAAREKGIGVWKAPATETPPFLASKNSKVFHHVSCPKAATIAPRNRRWFATREEAISSGRRPCRHCNGEPFGR